MILYFSGTGNTRFVTQHIASLLGDNVCDIASAPTLSLADDEPIGLVFPVYAWGLPQIVRDYIVDYLAPRVNASRYVWAVMTCGDDIGYADRVLSRALGRRVSAVWSVPMPNTYVSLPGFDVDPAEVAAHKVQDTLLRLPEITRCISQGQSCIDVCRGAVPWLKTYVLRPLFNRFLLTDKYFRANNACVSCGICARQCPKSDIILVDGRPHWGQSDCTGCLRCYHHCPHRAIDWGTFTVGKGQKHPLDTYK